MGWGNVSYSRRTHKKTERPGRPARVHVPEPIGGTQWNRAIRQVELDGSVAVRRLG